ncbi:MAG: DUF4270 family protein [Bacteroidales bacterium]
MVLGAFSLGVLLFSSCTKTNEFTIGKDFIDSQTNLQIIDTFRIDLSTILLDSLASSSTKVGLTGYYKDDVLGSVRCESYFDLAYQSFADIEDGAVFDSAAFVLAYSNYYYGDTTSMMTISIHQLDEKIVPFDNGYLYNNSSFSFNSVPVGSKSFYPTPDSPADSVVLIPVDALGEQLFTYIRTKDINVSSSEWFSDYLKGFVLVPDSVNGKAVIGIKANKNSLALKIYYHLNKEEPENKEIVIAMSEGSHQFNNVRSDFGGSPLSQIKNDGNEISSAASGNEAFLLGSVGLMPKILFPTLQNILLDRRWKVLKAYLVVEPEKTSYNGFQLPADLNLYDTDKENRLISVLKDNEGNTLRATFDYDAMFREDTRYTFDITSFINNELADSYVDYYHGLLIGVDQEKFRSSLDRLVVEGKKPPVKLRLYYLTY